MRGGACRGTKRQPHVFQLSWPEQTGEKKEREERKEEQNDSAP